VSEILISMNRFSTTDNSISMFPPSSVNLNALDKRLNSIFSILSLSTNIGILSSMDLKSRLIFFSLASDSNDCT